MTPLTPICCLLASVCVQLPSSAWAQKGDDLTPLGPGLVEMPGSGVALYVPTDAWRIKDRGAMGLMLESTVSRTVCSVAAGDLGYTLEGRAGKDLQFLASTALDNFIPDFAGFVTLGGDPSVAEGASAEVRTFMATGTALARGNRWTWRIVAFGIPGNPNAPMMSIPCFGPAEAMERAKQAIAELTGSRFRILPRERLLQWVRRGDMSEPDLVKLATEDVSFSQGPVVLAAAQRELERRRLGDAELIWFVQPPEAAVTVDGRPADGRATGLSIGQRVRIEAVAPGYERYVEYVKVTVASQPLEIALSPLPRAREHVPAVSTAKIALLQSGASPLPDLVPEPRTVLSARATSPPWFDASWIPDGRLAILSDTSVWVCRLPTGRCVRRGSWPDTGMGATILGLPSVVAVGRLTERSEIVVDLIPLSDVANDRSIVVATDAGQEAGGPPTLAALPDGGFAVAWSQGGPMTDEHDPGRGPYLRLYGPTGSPRGLRLRLGGRPTYATRPAVEVDPQAPSRLLVTWATNCVVCDGNDDASPPRVMASVLTLPDRRLAPAIEGPTPRMETREGAEEHTYRTTRLGEGRLLATWNPKGRPGQLVGEVQSETGGLLAAASVLVDANAERAAMGYSGFRILPPREGKVLVLWAEAGPGRSRIVAQPFEVRARP